MGNWTNKPVQLDPIEFDGDSIVFVVDRLKVGDMQVLSKYFSGDNGTLRFESPLEICAIAGELFPKYVRNISGMKNSDGAEFTVAEFLEAAKDFYFVGLIGQLFTKLIEVSTLKAHEKNSAPPSPV